MTVQPSQIKFLDVVDRMPVYVCSFDIETTSSTGKFSNAEVGEDRIVQIGLCFNDGKRILLNLGPVHESAKSDKELYEFNRS